MGWSLGSHLARQAGTGKQTQDAADWGRPGDPRLFCVRIKAERAPPSCQSKLACVGNLAVVFLILISQEIDKELGFSLVTGTSAQVTPF